jgi:hypothetical protein
MSGSLSSQASAVVAFLLTFGTGVLHFIQIDHQPDATIFQFIILTCLQLNMFRAFSRSLSGAQ